MNHIISLLSSHMHDLIETTKEVHYENYRSFHLKETQRFTQIMFFNFPKTNQNILQIYKTIVYLIYCFSRNALSQNEEQLDTLLKEKEKEVRKTKK